MPKCALGNFLLFITKNKRLFPLAFRITEAYLVEIVAFLESNLFADLGIRPRILANNLLFTAKK